MGMSNVLTADPRIPHTKLSSVDVDVRTVKDWTDWSTSSKDSVALCEIWLGEQGKPIYSSRSKADPHKRWASSPNDLALCGKWSEMLSCGAIYWLQTVLLIPQREGCWLGNKKEFYVTGPTNTLLLGSSFRAFLSVWMASLYSPCKARTLDKRKTFVSREHQRMTSKSRSSGSQSSLYLAHAEQCLNVVWLVCQRCHTRFECRIIVV